MTKSIHNSKLGRGIESLLGSDYLDQIIHQEANDKNQQRTTEVDIDLINTNSNQPRSQFNHHELLQLAESIKKDGIIQPLVINFNSTEGSYTLIAGERRLRAAKIAGLNSVPVIIKNLQSEDAFRIALVENIQRSDLNPIEEALAYKKIATKWGYSNKQVAELVAKDKSTIANFMRLLDLPKSICQDIINGKISAGHGRAILMIPDNELRLEACEKIKENSMSVRRTEAMCKQWKHHVSAYNITSAKEKTKAQNNHSTLLSDSQTKKPQKLDRQTLEKLTDDPNFKHLEQQLRERFGTRVRLCGSKQKGKIEVFYYSSEDFQRLSELMLS